MKGRFLLPFFIGLLTYLPEGFSQDEGPETSSGKPVTDSLATDVIATNDKFNQQTHLQQPDNLILLLVL
jgi:hypothetical protein